MLFSRRIKHLVSWIASCAILLAALVPALSHAVQSDAPEGWTEICTITGAKLVKLDGGTTDPSSTDPENAVSHAFKQCQYCAMHGDHLGLPPTASPMLDRPSLQLAQPALFLHAPRTLFAWASAQPRAPPLQA